MTRRRRLATGTRRRAAGTPAPAGNHVTRDMIHVTRDVIHVTRDVIHVACSAIIHTQNVTFTKYPGQNIRQTCKQCLTMFMLLYIIRKTGIETSWLHMN